MARLLNRLLTVLLVIVGFGSVWFAFRGVWAAGVHWDAGIDSTAAIQSRQVTPDMTLQDAYDSVIYTSEWYGILVQTLADWLNQQFTGAVDLTGATVTGLPVAESGLTNGVGANSLISSSALTTTPASAPLSGQIAIGNGATTGAFITNAIAIGNNASAGGGTAVGNGSQCFTAGRSAAYGAGAKSLSNESVAIGGDAVVASNSTGGIAIGDSATVATSSPNAVAIGNDVTASTDNTVTIKRLQMLDYATLDYADDAAAATGGIPLGGVYHTDGALKIRIV